MAASITIEEERGTYVRSPHHPHNGYYAGDFSGPPAPGIENDLRSTGLRAGSNASVRPA